jgi:hypothetical protein
MIELKVDLRRKDTEVLTKDCVVGKVVRISDETFNLFSQNLLREWDFIRDNKIEKPKSDYERLHCLLVLSEGHRDGILVDSQGSNYAYYSAFVPNAEDLLTVGRSPALAELNQKLTNVVDFVATITGQRYDFDLQEFEAKVGIDFMRNTTVRHTLMDMLRERPEIKSFENDKNELTVYYNEDVKQAEHLSDPAVTMTDMYAYGYGWDGMIPLGKERALELFEKGHKIYRLNDSDTEGVAQSCKDIEVYDGMFGVKNPEWKKSEHEPPLQVFILNREKYDRGEATGEWLSLPSDAEALQGLFEHIGINRPSENSFTVTAVRVRDDYIRDYISKYDSLDELNMLASYLNDMEDFETDKLQTVLENKGSMIKGGTEAVINLLDPDNFDAFILIDADDAEALGRYHKDEKPEEISFEEYGKQIIKDEGGVFTQEGYLYFRNKEITPEYAGIVSDEYRITGEALRGLRSKLQEKPSVLKRIKDSQKAPATPRKEKKQKGETEL